jgi:hypothetical protein
MQKPKKRPPPQSALVETITIDGSLDAHSLEALKLELKQLAAACGLEIREIAVVTERKA